MPMQSDGISPLSPPLRFPCPSGQPPRSEPERVTNHTVDQAVSVTLHDNVLFLRVRFDDRKVVTFPWLHDFRLGFIAIPGYYHVEFPDGLVDAKRAKTPTRFDLCT